MDGNVVEWCLKPGTETSSFLYPGIFQGKTNSEDASAKGDFVRC